MVDFTKHANKAKVMKALEYYQGLLLNLSTEDASENIVNVFPAICASSFSEDALMLCKKHGIEAIQYNMKKGEYSIVVCKNLR